MLWLGCVNPATVGKSLNLYEGIHLTFAISTVNQCFGRTEVVFLLLFQQQARPNTGGTSSKYFVESKPCSYLRSPKCGVRTSSITIYLNIQYIWNIYTALKTNMSPGHVNFGVKLWNKYKQINISKSLWSSQRKQQNWKSKKTTTCIKINQTKHLPPSSPQNTSSQPSTWGHQDRCGRSTCCNRGCGFLMLQVVACTP